MTGAALADAQGGGNGVLGPVRVNVRGAVDGLAGIGRGNSNVMCLLQLGLLRVTSSPVSLTGSVQEMVSNLPRTNRHTQWRHFSRWSDCIG